MSGNINFNGWINDDGSENYKCRAWVNFNGTGTVAIRASGNVSSITDNGIGEYTVNFTTAMVDADYSSMGCAMKQDGNGYSVYPNAKSIAPYYTAPTASSFTVMTSLTYNTTGTRADCEYVNIAVFR